MRTLGIMLALACLLVPCLARATSLDDLKLGTPISGPKLTPSDLEGKVVYVEFWGTW